MKIRISRWPRHYSFYSFLLKFKSYGISDEKVDDISDWLFNSPFQKIFDKLNNRQRKVKIRIDDHDVWNLYETLAIIIVPSLKRLKEIKHGSPYIDPDDVPIFLRDRAFTDDLIHSRWEYVLDEMIYAFECKIDDDLTDTSKATMAKTARIDNGMRLFAKYYDGLWD